MLRHSEHARYLADEQRAIFTSAYHEAYRCPSPSPKHQSPPCDDSGVFLDDPPSPRCHGKNRQQYTPPDSDAEKSDDLGLASSSIDSADDLDGDPLPSTINIVPQKPPPVPVRRSAPRPPDILDVTKVEGFRGKIQLSKSYSSGEDSNDMDVPSEATKNQLNRQTIGKCSNFASMRSYHEDVSQNGLPENKSLSHDSRSRTLSSSSKMKTLDVQNGGILGRNNESSSNLKWKSEECLLKNLHEGKWSIPGRRYEKSVSVKDRIAMFSEMEANQSPAKNDLQRYGSENNIKSAVINTDIHKMNTSCSENPKQENYLLDSKWHSMQSIAKRPPDKESTFINNGIKPSISIPSLVANSTDMNNLYMTLPVKLDVEPPKPVISTYPETQLTNNKRYNYGLYSLKNLKNTEDLLSKKVAGSTYLSIIDSRKQPPCKLKGLVISDKLSQQSFGKELPTIVSSDSESLKDSSRRGSLPITVVTSAKAMSLPRSTKSENMHVQRQTSLTEPPWKNKEVPKQSNATVQKYSPAFKKRSLELPGSSISPSPPSSITSPMSPAPSSPSSICSSNASSSTLQQNVFQFSLTHSKPVQPLLPEKALMSPPSLPSDMDYEGDNSEDSGSHSSAPTLKNLPRDMKQTQVSPAPLPSVPNCKTGSFTSCSKPLVHQPLLVEALAKPVKISESQPRAAICISKTEIQLKRDKSRPKESTPDVIPKKELPDFINSTSDRFGKLSKSNCKDYIIPPNKIYENGNNTAISTSEYIVNQLLHQNGISNGDLKREYTLENDVIVKADVSSERLKGFPLTGRKSNGNYRKDADKFRPLHSEGEESDDDSHSTLSHHTTDECLSDATTDSFEKQRLVPNTVPLSQTIEDYASTEGYMSDASTTDISLSRFPHQTAEGSVCSLEDYLSDNRESCDPDWVLNQTSQKSRYGDITQTDSLSKDTGLKTKSFSQLKTVLKTSAEPSDSVQKFKALTEKWEQRVDVTSPPPSLPAASLAIKKDSARTVNSMAAAILSTNSLPKTKSSLPPSLMPRAPSVEKKDTIRHNECAPVRRLNSSQDHNGYSHIDETHRSDPGSRLDALTNNIDAVNTNRSSRRIDDAFSKGMLKHSIQSQDSDCSTKMNGHDPSSNGVLRSTKGTWNNEPRNRRGVDFTSRSQFTQKSSVSDIRRSFESPCEEVKPAKLPKKTPTTDSRDSASVVLPSSVTTMKQKLTQEEDAEHMSPLLQSARAQLQEEGLLNGDITVLGIILRREGADGGSVGITLAGGADYEIKEITVHKVISGSLADRDGRIYKGDRVMSINGKSIRGVTHREALQILKAPAPKVFLVLARKTNQLGKEIKKNESSISTVSRASDGEMVIVDLPKDVTGLGFIIEGGKDSPQGDRPLAIKRVFKGSAADKDGRIEAGDELLAVNEHSMTNLTRTEAWSLMKKIPDGIVLLKLRKASVAL